MLLMSNKLSKELACLQHSALTRRKLEPPSVEQGTVFGRIPTMNQQGRLPSKRLLALAVLLGIPALVALIGLNFWTKSQSLTKPPAVDRSFRPPPSQTINEIEESLDQWGVEAFAVTEAEAEIVSTIMNDLDASRVVSDCLLANSLVLANDLGFDAKTQFLKELMSIQPELVSRNAQELLYFIAGWDLDASNRMKIAQKLLIPTYLSAGDFKVKNAAIHLLEAAAIPRELATQSLPRQHVQHPEIKRCFAVPFQSLIDNAEYGRLKVELGEDMAKACMAIANRDLSGPWFQPLPESARRQIAQYFVRQYVKAASPETAKQRTIDPVETVFGGAGLDEYVVAIGIATKDLQRPLPAEVLDEWASAMESSVEFHHDFLLNSTLNELASQSVPDLRNRALVSIVNRALSEKDPRFLAQFTRLASDLLPVGDSRLASSVSTRVFQQLATTSWADGFETMLGFSNVIAMQLDSVDKRSFALALLARCESNANPEETIAILSSIAALKPEFDPSEISRFRTSWKESFESLKSPDYVRAVYWDTLANAQAWHPIVLDQEWVDFFLRDVRIAGPRLETGMEQALELIVSCQERREEVAQLNGRRERIKSILQSALQSDSDRAEARIWELLHDKPKDSFGQKIGDQNPLPRCLELLRTLDHDALLRIHSECLQCMNEDRRDLSRAATILVATIQQVDDANKLGIDSFPPHAIHWLSQDQFEQVRTLASVLSREKAERLCEQSLTFMDDSNSTRRLRHMLLLCEIVKSGVISVDKVLARFLESNRRYELREAKTILDSLIPFLSLEVIEQKLRQSLDDDRLSTIDELFLSKSMEHWMREAPASRVDALMTELLELSRRLDSRSNARRLLMMSKFPNRSSQCLELCKQLWDQEPDQISTLEKSMSFLEANDLETFRDYVRKRIEAKIQQGRLKDYVRTLPKILPVKECFGVLASNPGQVDVTDFLLCIASKHEELTVQEKQKLLTLWADQVRLSGAAQVERVGSAIEPLRSELENWQPVDLLPHLIQLLPQSQKVLAMLAKGKLSMEEIKSVIAALTTCKDEDVSATLSLYVQRADSATCYHGIELLETRWKSEGIASLEGASAYVVLLNNFYSDDRDFVIAAFQGLGMLYSNTSFPAAKAVAYVANENGARLSRSIILRAISQRLAVSRNSQLGLYSSIEYCKRFGLLVDETQLTDLGSAK
jgi:hypothetical protein